MAGRKHGEDGEVGDEVPDRAPPQDSMGGLFEWINSGWRDQEGGPPADDIELRQVMGAGGETVTPPPKSITISKSMSTQVDHDWSHPSEFLDAIEREFEALARVANREIVSEALGDAFDQLDGLASSVESTRSRLVEMARELGGLSWRAVGELEGHGPSYAHRRYAPGSAEKAREYDRNYRRREQPDEG